MDIKLFVKALTTKAHKPHTKNGVISNEITPFYFNNRTTTSVNMPLFQSLA
ncbi:MAG: hypothetical protein ACJA0T_000952 [Colwellia sp.]|jgi:hypothetical protein